MTIGANIIFQAQLNINLQRDLTRIMMAMRRVRAGETGALLHVSRVYRMESSSCSPPQTCPPLYRPDPRPDRSNFRIRVFLSGRTNFSYSSNILFTVTNESSPFSIPSETYSNITDLFPAPELKLITPPFLSILKVGNALAVSVFNP